MMKSYSFTFSLVIISIIILISPVISNTGFGKCQVKTPSVVQNFQLNRYLGKWFEQFRDKNTPFQKGDCVIAEYTLFEDKYSKNELKIRVTNSELELNESKKELNYLNNNNENDERKQRRVAHGRAFSSDPSVGKLLVTFAPEYLDNFDFIKGPYWVLDTDYENFTFVYSCKEILGLYYSEFFWVLTREKRPNEETLQQYLKTIQEKYGYSADKFRSRTVQGDDVCFN